MKKAERIKMVKAMEYIARQINDEDVFERWLIDGAADGDIGYGDLAAEDDGSAEYYTDDERFAHLMGIFLWCMREADRTGGLYCGDVVSM